MHMILYSIYKLIVQCTNIPDQLNFFFSTTPYFYACKELAG